MCQLTVRGTHIWLSTRRMQRVYMSLMVGSQWVALLALRQISQQSRPNLALADDLGIHKFVALYFFLHQHPRTVTFPQIATSDSIFFDFLADFLHITVTPNALLIVLLIRYPIPTSLVHTNHQKVGSMSVALILVRCIQQHVVTDYGHLTRLIPNPWGSQHDAL